MSRVGRNLVRLVCGVLAVLVATAVPGVAQAPPAGAAKAGAAPVMTFGPDGVSLEQAVSIALKNDPALRLAEQDVLRLEGALQEQRGRYDFTLNINADFEHRVQELSETRKADERKKRKDLADDITSYGGESTLLAQAISVLSRLQTTNPGDPLVRQLLTFSPTLASQLQLLDAMILDPATPAASRAEFRRIRTETIQEALTNAQTQKTQVDTARQESEVRLANLGETPDDEFFRTGALSISIAKVFRSGVTFSPFADGSIDTTTFVGKPIAADMGGKGVQDQMKFRVGAGFSLPILRGRGAEAFASGERSSRVRLDAGRLQLEHRTAQTALAVARAYWGLRGAVEALNATKRSTEIQTRVVEITKALIQAGEMPAIELARAQAGEARAVASVKDAERRLQEARVGLALAMGLSATADAATLPSPRDAFPAAATIAPPSAAFTDGWSADAIERRRDLAAARKYEEAAAVLERSADRNTLPKLDVSGETYWTALGQRAFKRVADRWVGPSVSVGVDFEMPFGNNALEGALAQREAEHRQQQISAADLERQVRLGVVRAAATLQEALVRAQQTETAVELYQKTVDAELERFRVGESTLINTLTTERQLTDARLAAVSAAQQLATLVAELRYETGTLVEGGAVSGASLISVPRAGGR